MKKLTALVLTAVMILSLAACSSGTSDNTQNGAAQGNSEAQQVTEATTAHKAEVVAAEDVTTEPAFEEETFAPFDGPKELVVGISADIGTWDPWGSFSGGRQNMAPVIYQALTADIANQETYEIVHYNVLAESTERIGNGEYRIKIREGIVDTAGNPFTAEDAIFSYQTCIDQGRLGQVAIIESMEQEDDLTFVMKLSSDNVGGFSDICAAINMVTKESYEASPDGMQTTPVGTSPMVLESYTQGSEAVFVKADSYWNDAANESKDVKAGYCGMWDYSNIDKVTYRIINNITSMELALENGEIDIARAISSEDVESFENSDTVKTFFYWDGSYSIAFNTSENSVCQNKNLREAIAYAIDSESCLSAACDNRGGVATCWSFWTFFDYLDEWTDREYFNYNMDTAKDYLKKFEEETGMKASDLSLELLYQNEDTAEATALTIQNFIGILTGNPNCVTLTSYDRGTYTSTKKSPDTFDITIVNGQLTTRTTSCYNWNDVSNTKVQGYNIFHDYTGEIDKYIEPVMAEETHNDDTVRAFQQFIDDNCYLKCLFYEVSYGAAAGWIHNTGAAIGAKGFLNIGALTYDWANSGK
ncbi:MAG: ABC transporter substrate-binding protein [Lachnospiraceae bacterium]|nr:ABC transporter substrate-binding protein [Lachnospiraceae bacterium]